MIGWFVAPFSNMDAMDVLLPILDSCWEPTIQYDPTQFSLLCLCAFGCECTIVVGGVVATIASVVGGVFVTMV